VPQEGAPIREWREAAKEGQPACVVECDQPGEEQTAEQLDQDTAGRRNAGREDIHRCPSRVMPPPGTIMCTWG